MEKALQSDSVETCIVNTCEILGVEARKLRTPISEPIDTDSIALPAKEAKTFLTGLDMLGWLATTVRCDVTYTYSRIAQHCAKTNTSAMAAVKRAFSYLPHTKEHSLSAKVFEHDRPISSIAALKPASIACLAPLPVVTRGDKGCAVTTADHHFQDLFARHRGILRHSRERALQQLSALKLMQAHHRPHIGHSHDRTAVFVTTILGQDSQ